MTRTISIATTVLYLAGAGVRALPIPDIDQRASSSCDDLENCRTKWNIIWSCAATIFACVWVAVHPNIPGRDESFMLIALRRAGIMVLALVAPELVVAWAMRQWVVASRLAREDPLGTFRLLS